MKNKSKLLLLPVSLFLVTGCATANTSIPRGYTDVDKSDAAAREAFFNKVSDDIALTYAKAAEGFSMEGSFGIKELYYKQSANNSFKLSNFEADYSFGLVGLNEGTNKAKAVLKVENLGFKLNIVDDGKEYSIKASDLDAAAYYTDSSLYYDLSDKDIKNFVNEAIKLDYEMDGKADKKDEIAAEQEQAAKYLGKYYIKGSSSVEDVVDEIPTGLDAETKADIKEMVSEVFEGLLAQDKVKDLLTLAEDKNSKGAAVAFALSSEPVEVEGMKVSGDLAASVVFDKEGLFSRFGFAGSVEASDGRSTNDGPQIKLNKLDLGANFKYGANSVKLPNFSDYQQFGK